MPPSSPFSPETSLNLLKTAYNGDLTRFKGVVEKSLMEVVGPKKRTLLHIAASGGHIDLCKYLVETLNFDVNVKDVRGDTPLHLANMKEQFVTCAYLVDSGANPCAVNNEGMTPLHYAAKKGRKDQMCLLIKRGAVVDAQSETLTPLQNVFSEKSAGMKDAVEILLEHQANPNLATYQFHTPLVLAILERSVDCTRLLLEHGADPNLMSEGLPPLVVAAAEGVTEIIECLLKFGADPNGINYFGQTPIEIAALHGPGAAMKALFPVTKRIRKYLVWSVQSIYDNVMSEAALRQLMIKMDKNYLKAKTKGAAAVKKGDYVSAIAWYTRATVAANEDVGTAYSNRSYCWAQLKIGDYALADAVSCIRMKPSWAKGYYRAGVAWRVKKDFKSAVQAFTMALSLDPGNKGLEAALRDAKAEIQEEPCDFCGLFDNEAPADDEFAAIFQMIRIA